MAALMPGEHVADTVQLPVRSLSLSGKVMMTVTNFRIIVGGREIPLNQVASVDAWFRRNTLRLIMFSLLCLFTIPITLISLSSGDFTKFLIAAIFSFFFIKGLLNARWAILIISSTGGKSINVNVSYQERERLLEFKNKVDAQLYSGGANYQHWGGFPMNQNQMPDSRYQ